MTNSYQHQTEILQDRYGLKVAARLSAGVADIPHDVLERLRVARIQAVSQRRIHHLVGATSVPARGGAIALGGGDEGLSWWNRVASVLPLLALAIGLVAINTIQNDLVADEIAVVDAALLVDDLPPAAYTDPGFVQFIRIGRIGAE